MSQPLRTQAVVSQTVYAEGDFVLYRDAERFWLGESDHTFVGRVHRAWRHGGTGRAVYDLIELSSNSCVTGIDPDYMRLLPPADAMADIDTAPLTGPDTGAMPPAAVAWIRQHFAQVVPTLPDPCD
ncbi:hypothetical protein [Streptomyces xinghaiensis]|uniref:hypothetical protein n=1 Tax=Streptomyces xinghaiensis TaxID=1038928 RepID=UPI0002FD6D9F|nr:hypothetical protein [Streptomyces xinghaiensis]MZE76771.1 hypothetical protein [Streptomyces sp. SID5475]